MPPMSNISKSAFQKALISSGPQQTPGPGKAAVLCHSESARSFEGGALVIAAAKPLDDLANDRDVLPSHPCGVSRRWPRGPSERLT